MANPRNKNKDKENEVTDPSNAEATAEATPPTEAPAPAEPKVEIDHSGNLFKAIVDFSTSDPKDVAALQTAYREVPAAARGKVQGVAMKRAMTEGNVDMEVLGEVLDAFNNLPAASKSSRTKVEVDPLTAGTIRLAGLMTAYEAVRAELGDVAAAAQEQVNIWFSEGTPEASLGAVLKVAENVVKAASKGGKGGAGGPRNSFKQTLKELVDAGALPADATLKGANDAEATIDAEGNVTTQGQTFDNLSAAARLHRPSKTEGGKATSTNGWDFWQYDGKPVGSLRTF